MENTNDNLSDQIVEVLTLVKDMLKMENLDRFPAAKGTAIADIETVLEKIKCTKQ